MKLMCIMISYTSSFCFMRVISCSSLLYINQAWFSAYIGADMFIYLFFKIVRNNFRYWLRIDGLPGLFISLLTRVVVKFVNDFTLNPQFRHPMDVGGIYWTFNMIAHQLFCFVSVYLLQEFGEDIDEARVTALWIIVTALFIFTNANFCWFLTLINKKYLTTFFDMRTGKQFLCDLFRDASTDKEKFYIFSKHKSYYKSINKEIKEWLTEENWERWEENDDEEDNSSWFNPKGISHIPEELLPPAVLASMGGAKGRRASIDAMKEEEKKFANSGMKVRRNSNLQIVAPSAPTVGDENV